MMGSKRESEKEEFRRPDIWIETSDNSFTQICRFNSDGRLSVKVANDSRPVYHTVVESFLNKFFPSGYPYSVNEGYLTYTQFRALQHFSSAVLSVLSTQVLKDGMQHAGKLICSRMGARMDSEPKSWRILGNGSSCSKSNKATGQYILPLPKKVISATYLQKGRPSQPFSMFSE